MCVLCTNKQHFTKFIVCTVLVYITTRRPTRAHHKDEKPERDLTYHLTCLLIYHGTTTHL